MKGPISYYGGKAMLASKIVDMIPQHITYVEPFCGGAAIFWAKEPSGVEILNDTNKELVNFYIQCKVNSTELDKLIKSSLHSRDLHRDAWVVYNHPHLFTEVKRAWAVWVLSAMGFSSQLSVSFGVSIKNDCQSKKIMNKRESFGASFAQRLEKVTAESRDALEVIQQYDTPESFHYCDPPYFNSDCAHYKGYSKEDFRKLLGVLSKVQGKFLLSSYPSDLLDEYIEKHGWKHERIDGRVSVARKKDVRKAKVECLTWNY
jgi:DNA adenine methylase